MNRLNWSTLKHMAVSPLMMRWRAEHPRPDTEALKLGRAIHCLVLEGEDVFRDRWATSTQCAATTKAGTDCGSAGTLFHDWLWYCRVKGHAPAGAGAPPADMEVIDSQAREVAHVCANSLLTHAEAQRTLSNGSGEQELEWEFDGVACRGRLDYLREYVVDLKTTRYGTPREFMRDAATHLYHGQLAWYHDGAVRAGRIADDAETPRIVSVETAEPYDVAVYQCPPEVLEAGRLVYRDLLRKYQECNAAGWWPGHSPDLRYVELPKWADGMQLAEEITDW